MDKFKLPPEYDNSELQRLADLLADNFPQFVKEHYIDFDELKSYLTGVVPDDLREKYSFTWHGKTESYRLLKKNSNGTLLPCREDSVNWDATQNLYLEGDNMEVLKLIKHTYAGQQGVKMIYIDPPYNTGNDFVYDDDFMDSLDKYLEYTGQVGLQIPEENGRYHTRWLNMMYPRLWLANYLLRDDGVIFISIDDNEVHNLRKICDEVFGDENFVGKFIWRKRTGSNDSTNNVSNDHEYIVCYSKSNLVKFNGVTKEFENYTNPDNDPRGDWTRGDLTCNKTASERPNLYYHITDPATGIEYQCSINRVWAYEKNRMQQAIDDGKVIFPKDGKGTPMYKRHKSEVRSDKKPFSSLLETKINTVSTKEVQALMDGNIFSHPKSVDLIKQLAAQITNANENDIILDFFSGSATTAHAVMQLNAEDGGNRRYICIQIPEPCDPKSEAFKAGYKNICEIGKERIRRAGAKILSEWQEKQVGQAQVALGEDSEETTQTPPDTGFRVFKLAKSNFKIWDDTPIDDTKADIERFHKQLEIFADNPFIEGRTHEDIIYEIMRMNNYPLTTTIIPIPLENGNGTVYGIGEDPDFIICLDVLIDDVAAEELCEYRPGRILFTDSCFKDTEMRTNVEHTIKNINAKIKLKVV